VASLLSGCCCLSASCVHAIGISLGSALMCAVKVLHRGCFSTALVSAGAEGGTAQSSLCQPYACMLQDSDLVQCLSDSDILCSRGNLT